MDVRDAPMVPAVDMRMRAVALIVDAGIGIPERALAVGSAVGCSV